MKSSTNSVFLSVILLLAITASIAAELLSERNRKPDPDIFSGRTLRCSMALKNDIAHKGLHGNLNYELLEMLAKDKSCSLDIRLAEEDWKDSLKQGAVDLVVVEKGYTDSSFIYATIGSDSVIKWALSKDSTEMHRQISLWLKDIKKDGRYGVEHNRFITEYLSRKDNSDGSISPYDSIIKVYADSIGWDWKLVAAVIFRESRFSILSNSKAGAAGLMQVMPKYASKFGAGNLLDPEENIKSGTTQLQRLHQRYLKEGYTGQEAIKFTLAAYNAGVGRIRDCIRLADALSREKRTWDDIVSIIPYMSELDSLDCSDTVRLGTFKGAETIGFVKGVLSTYEEFSQETTLP